MPYPRSQGGVFGIQDGGFGEGELHAEEEAYRFMDEAATFKENVKALNADLRVERQLNLEKDDQLQAVKEKLKTIVARSVEAFHQIEEYATVLFGWYFKGFELLRRYLVKHPTGVDLPNLDLEVVDQEMTMDKAAQSLAFEGDAPKKTPGDNAPSGDAPTIDDPSGDAPTDAWT